MPDAEHRPRPRNAAGTRALILAEARRQFSARGYAATTLRSVASAAEVSPNLISRYFGSKEGLFAAATEAHLDVAEAMAGPRSSFGRRFADAVIGRWTGIEDAADPMLMLLRVAGERPEAAAELTRILDEEAAAPIRARLRDYGFSEAQAADRAHAIEAIVLGLVIRRRVLDAELGDPEQLRAWLADTVQRVIRR